MVAELLQLAQQTHVLLINMHHIISDGWSMGIFISELTALYQAAVHGEANPLPPLPIQYPDYAAWQRQWLTGETLDRQVNYWRQHLGTDPDPLNLPTDFPRPAHQTFNGDAVEFQFSPAQNTALEHLCKTHGVTPHMALLTVFQLLLHRYSGQEDIIVGSPIAGRNHPRLEGLIGFFVNTLVLKTRVQTHRTFDDLLHEVRRNLLEAYEHQDVPFEKLVESLNVRRDQSRSPLFQVMFILQNTPNQAVTVADLEFAPIADPITPAKFDLTLTFAAGEHGYIGNLNYNTDLFQKAAATAMAERFLLLFDQLTAQTSRPIANAAWITPAEQQTLQSWNRPPAEPALHSTIPALFAEQVIAAPNANALSHGRTTLTYAELDRRANGIANALIQHGVKPGDLIAVCSGRDTHLIAALLAILKTGAAYVPLDPDYPADRIAYTLADSKATVLLTRTHLIPDLPVGNHTVLDLDNQALLGASQSDPGVQIQPDALSHVIYTSGSTGKPKGVAVRHHNVAALIGWMRDTYTAEETAMVVASTSICFDLSIFEIFGTLAVGGTIALIRNALELPTLDQPVTLLNTVPSAMTELLRLNGVPQSIRVVNLAGEPLRNALAQDIYALPHVDKVYNLYGPSEDTTYSTGTLVPRGAKTEPTIGRPLPHTRAYILDPAGRRQPIGIPGELCLSGAGLSTGYLNQGAATAQKFIPNLFEDNGSRLYRTGDLARFRPDGELEFLGRMDHQVKLRGFRIELGEIEAVLLTHDAVELALVTVREDQPGNPYLAAYIQSKASDIQDALRQVITTHLPSSAKPWSCRTKPTTAKPWSPGSWPPPFPKTCATSWPPAYPTT